jgi:hypothetical protein
LDRKDDELQKLQQEVKSIGQSAVPYLIDVMTNNRSQTSTISFAAEALRIIHDERAIQPLIKTLSSNRIGDLAIKPLKAFGPRCVPFVIEEIQQHLHNPGKDTDYFFIYALGLIGEIQCEESINFLNNLLDDYTSKMPDEPFDIDTYEWEYQEIDIFHLLDCMVRQQNKKAIPYIKKLQDRFPKEYVDHIICQIAIGRIKKGRVEGYLPIEAMELNIPTNAIMNAFMGINSDYEDDFEKTYGEYLQDTDEDDTEDE